MEVVPSISRSRVDIGIFHAGLNFPPANEIRVYLQRPEDLVIFDLVFNNMTLVIDKPPMLIRQDEHFPSYFIVEFPPQCFGEQAFNEEQLPGLPSSRIRMASRSRIVFSMPESQKKGFDSAQFGKCLFA